MWIEFDGIVNTRDLGGIPTADGRRVRPGRLLRGAALENASDADIAKLSGPLSVRHIVDFRDAGETEERPDRAVPDAAYHSFPALPPLQKRAPMTDTPPDFFSVFLKVYAKLAESDSAAAAYRGFFRVLLDCPDGAVYFHCAQGKDRTGIAAILALCALGVSEEEALADYFRSNEGLRASMEHPEVVGVRPWPRETLEKLFTVFPETVGAYLDAVKRACGDMDSYLRTRIGLTDADFARLRALYLE